MPVSKRRPTGERHRKGPTPRGTSGAGDVVSGSGQPSLPAPSARYSPPPVKNRGLFRPTWHKAVGWLLVLAGVAIFVLNDLAWFDVHVMPGGHSELYAGLAFLVGGSSTWWFGLFDRTPGR